MNNTWIKKLTKITCSLLLAGALFLGSGLPVTGTHISWHPDDYPAKPVSMPKPTSVALFLLAVAGGWFVLFRVSKT